MEPLLVFAQAFVITGMVAAYLYFYAGERPLTVVLAALACVAFTYGFMNRLMEIQLYEGLLFEYLR